MHRTDYDELRRLRDLGAEACRDQYKSGRVPHEAHLAETYARIESDPRYRLTPRRRENVNARESFAERTARKKAQLEREFRGERPAPRRPSAPPPRKTRQELEQVIAELMERRERTHPRFKGQITAKLTALRWELQTAE